MISRRVDSETECGRFPCNIAPHEPPIVAATQRTRLPCRTAGERSMSEKRDIVITQLKSKRRAKPARPHMAGVTLQYIDGMNQEWPALPLDEWRDTYATLHMWSQVVGKIALACTPRLNHFWNVAFQVTARGLSTGRLKANGRTFGLAFDFVDHQLVVQTSE